MKTIEDLIGRTFGRLTAVQRAPKGRNSASRYYCICACDLNKQPKTYYASNLIQGGTKSCGCLKTERMREHARTVLRQANSLPPGEAAWRRAMHVYKSNADSRGIEFSLSVEEFRHLVDQPCLFCGREGTNYTKTRSRIHPDVIWHNGIDRLDNDVGYTVENSAPCCDICNFMKRHLGLPEFLAHVRLIAKTTAEYDLTGIDMAFGKEKMERLKSRR